MRFADFITREDVLARTDPVGRFAFWLFTHKNRVGGYLQIKQFLWDQGADDWHHEALELAYDEFALTKSRREREQLLAR